MDLMDYEIKIDKQGQANFYSYGIEISPSTANYMFPDYERTIIREYYPTFYPSYVNYEKSKLEQSFRVASKLMQIGVVNAKMTVKQFIELVNEVADVL